MHAPVDQTWSIERIATEAPPRTWEATFVDAMPELRDVSTILEEDERTYGPYYPWKQDIFASFHYTPLPNVKLVIIGQDPYHQTIIVNGISMPRAVGLSFSVRPEDSVPSSLKNIYTELANTVRGFTTPDHGDLREWARQGVLLLNSCLTVRPGAAGSHGDIWLGFMNKVFRAISAVNPYCIYMLWGREAQKLKPMLGERSIILEAAHPSGLSARRGFFGSNHFNLANEALIRQGKVGINWRISTLAELKRLAMKVEVPPPATHTGHEPKFAPVDMAMLPTIISMQAYNGNTPPIPKVAIPGQYKITPPLPMIPNTKPIVPTGQMERNLSPTLPPVPPSPNEKPISPTPIIPKIQFGATLPAPMTIGLERGVPKGVVEVPQFIPAQPPVRQTAQSPPNKITGLPMIPAVIR